jgi:hypothetical protein
VCALWRRKETLNEKLLREAGYSPDGLQLDEADDDDSLESTLEEDPEQPPRQPSRRPRSREPHFFATAEAPDLDGDFYAFTVLPDGSMVVDDACEQDLSRLADAAEEHLSPPYGAEAARHGDGSWTVAAWPIKVSQFVADGDELELTSIAGERSYTVDGDDFSGALVPAELIRFGESRSEDYAVHAVRLDEDFWETDVNPL